MVAADSVEHQFSTTESALDFIIVGTTTLSSGVCGGNMMLICTNAVAPPPLVAHDSVENQFCVAESAVDLILAGTTSLRNAVLIYLNIDGIP